MQNWRDENPSIATENFKGLIPVIFPSKWEYTQKGFARSLWGFGNI
jgi:hypothetical protein